MAQKIALLDASTINQIAAGEVVERPAAVVKELVENAIDSGANAITIEIKDGGTTFIRITDNGSGIEKEEVKMAFMRHTTSKIRFAKDLLSVTSLGFRGEALSSIASVSQVEMVTKRKSDLTGCRYIIEGGEEKVFEEVGCPDGTTFLIRNLFFNVPARRKFLKSPTTEASYISDLVERLAMSHSEISFKFMNNNHMKLHTSGNNNVKDIIYHIYGREVISHLLPVNHQKDCISLTGFIGKPVISRGNRNYMNCYMNGRYIKSTVLYKAIEDAYKPYVMSHKYPFTVLYLQMDSSYIDVNVHPTKMEIRFTNGEEVYLSVFQVISEVLKGKEFIPKVSIEQRKDTLKKMVEKNSIPEPFETVRREQLQHQKQSQDQNQEQNKKSILEPFLEYPLPSAKNTSFIKEPIMGQELYKQTRNQTNRLENETQNESQEAQNQNSNNPFNPFVNSLDVNAKQITLFEQNFISEESIKKYHIIGQLFSTYWIIELENTMYLIDQHAAHEKILYEALITRFEKKEFASQILNPPIVLSLSMREISMIETYREEFEQLGFEIEPFGGKEYTVGAVPTDLFGLVEKDVLIEMIDALTEEQKAKTPNIIIEKIASISCKAAVKGNHTLSTEEANALVKQLFSLENPYHCPHGRPIIISMSKYEIEKKFKRVIS